MSDILGRAVERQCPKPASRTPARPIGGALRSYTYRSSASAQPAAGKAIPA